MRDIETKFPYLFILDMHVRNKKTGILNLYLAKLVNTQHKKFKKIAALVYRHVYINIMVILRSHNKITNFLWEPPDFVALIITM